MSAANEESEPNLPSWQLAREGIKLLINNKQQDAEALFKLHPENLHMTAGYAYAIVTDALMSFEDEKIHTAFQVLKDLERKCSSYSSWMRSVKSKMFGSDTSHYSSYADQLESQIILADALVFVASLSFLQQDISGYFKGSWILRKSYKHYQQVYNELLGLYNEIGRDVNAPGGSKSPSTTPPRQSPCSSSSSQTNISLKPVSADPRLAKGPPKREESTQEVVMPSPETEDLLPKTDVIESKEILETEPIHVKWAESSREVTKTEVVVNYLPTVEQGNNEVIVSVEQTNEVVISEQPEEIHANDPSIPCSSLARNGYISNTSALPKHSTSCHADLNPGGARNAGVKNVPLLTKSASVNSALSAQAESQRRSISFSNNLSYFATSLNIFSSKVLTKNIDKTTICRLLCAVSFGYGLLQLGISLLPPSVLKVTSIFGFGGNRKMGLEKLMYARTGTDMRAPFASLALLWYHTIVRPFFALDGNNVQAGVTAAAQLIEETAEEFGQSALFLFFKGRVERLNADIPAAIGAFQTAIDNATQREVKVIAMHEVGWCYLISLDYVQSENIFQRLKQSSRWSRGFYAYMALVSSGANGTIRDVKNVSELRYIFQSVPRGTQLDEFLKRRFSICPYTEKGLKETESSFWKLLVYELLYLWNALPSCTRENVLKIIGDCEGTSETFAEPMPGLAKLIQGSCHCILRDFENGVRCFMRSLELRNGLPYNSDTAHISAFAQYELGLLLVKKEETRLEGKKHLQSVSNYKTYDFEQRLSVRVHAILKHL